MATTEEFSQEELLEQAQGNLTAFILTTMSYMTQLRDSVEDWITFTGRTFAPGWDGMRGRGAREVMRVVALNAVSGGAQLESLSGDENEAQATVANWPPEELLHIVGVSRSDVEPFWNIFRPIADYLGFDYQYQSQGDRHTLTLRKK